MRNHKREIFMPDNSTTKENHFIPPNIVIISPDVSEPIYSREITISGLVSYPGGVLADLQLMVSGFDSPIAPDGLWQSTVPLNRGSNIIIIEVFDRLDSTNSTRSDLEIIRLVTPPPEVTITTPTDNLQTTDSDVIVSGSSFAYGEPFNIVERIEVNGIPAQRSSPNRWNLNFVPLKLGENIIEAIVFDTEGNTGQAQVRVFRN